MTAWYYHQPGTGRVGPLEAEQLRGYFLAGRVQRETLVWREGMAEWRPLEQASTELGLGPEQLSTPAPPQPPPLPPGFGPPAPPPGNARPGPAVQAAAPQAHAFVPPPQPRRMSGCLIAVIAACVVAVPVMGILAALTIPPYRQYVLRSKVMAAMAEATPLKLQVAEFQAQHGRCPDNDSEGFGEATAYASAQVAAITVGRFESGHCGMEVRVRGTASDKVDGKAVWLEYDGQRWQCSSEIEDPLLPADCRG